MIVRRPLADRGRARCWLHALPLVSRHPV